MIIALLTVYCTGLMRDRRRLDEMDDAESSDGSDEEPKDEAMTADCGHKETAESPLKTDLTLSEQQMIPSHEERVCPR